MSSDGRQSHEANDMPTATQTRRHTDTSIACKAEPISPLRIDHRFARAKRGTTCSHNGRCGGQRHQQVLARSLGVFGGSLLPETGLFFAAAADPPSRPK